MSKTKRNTLAVKGASVAVLSENRQDFISLTDIARFKNPERSDDLVRNWLRNRNTVEFLGIWETLHNPDFNSVEFDGIRIQTGLNSFILTPNQKSTINNRHSAISPSSPNLPSLSPRHPPPATLLFSISESQHFSFYHKITARCMNPGTNIPNVLMRGLVPQRRCVATCASVILQAMKPDDCMRTTNWLRC
jgi:hypothetical protein